MNTVIVGASAAGLSTATCLAALKVEHVLLERAPQVGAAWRGHYQRLHLHTTKRLSELPDHPWDPQVEAYPARLEVVRYLEAYAARLPTPPRFGESVTRITRDPAGWRTETAAGDWTSKNVVVATGYTRRPHLPTWPGQEGYRGDLLHSAHYVTGDRWRGQRVLVVGFGNSACEIAIDLHERGAKPTIAVRGGVNILPRDLFGLPVLGVGIAMSFLPAVLADWASWPLVRATIGDVRSLGLKPLAYGPNVQIRKHGRIPLLDIGTVALIRAGSLVARPGIERFSETGVIYSDGRAEDFAAVVLATGYRPAVHDFLADAGAVCTMEGAPLRSGYEVLPGLFFCGFYVSPTGMLREIGIEARRIAQTIAAADPERPDHRRPP